LNKEYIPYKYWNTVKNPNRAITKGNEEQVQKMINDHIEYISKNIKNDKLILDYGCGVGRTLKCYNSDYHQIVGADISLIYKDKIIKEANNMGLYFSWIHVNDNRLPYDDNYFDTTACISVLQHTRPFDILDIMNELKRVSKKVIIVTKYSKNGKDNKHIGKDIIFNRHNFHYDYKKICKDNNFNISNIERSGVSVMFCYE